MIEFLAFELNLCLFKRLGFGVVQTWFHPLIAVFWKIILSALCFLVYKMGVIITPTS